MKMNTLFIFIPLLIITCFFLIGWTTNLPNQIHIGQKAPLFELYNQNEELISLEQYLGKKVVIYFFPRTFTPGWTKQACGFRDQYDIYKKNNIEVLGISYASSNKHKEFSNAYSLKFQMLSDTNKKVSILYGVYSYFFPQRVTFLIDENGIVFDIVKNISLDNYAEDIIKKFNIKTGFESDAGK